MLGVTLTVIIFTLALGCAVLMANPKRVSNQAYASICLILIVWLACVFGAMHAGNTLAADGKASLMIWIRGNAIVASFLPWGIWVLGRAILHPAASHRDVIWCSWPTLTGSIFLAGICFWDSFAIAETAAVIRRGGAYYLYTAISLGLYAAVSIYIGRSLFSQTGIRRLELQYLALNCGIGGLLVAAINGIGNHFHLRALNRASILVVFAAYLFMAWALAHHRIFNARHALAAVGHRLAVLGVLALSAWGLSIPLAQFMAVDAAWIVSTILCGTGVFWLDQKARIWARLDDELLLAAFRSEIIHTSQNAADSSALLDALERLLAKYYNASGASLLLKREDGYARNGIAFARDRIGLGTLSQCSWITPESLQRRRPSPGLDDLHDFLRQHALGVIVTVPRGSPSPAMLVAIGTKANEWPFTYPEVQQLQNIAELIDNILTRSLLTDQAALQTRLEHLAMMSRGLAHDLKNLITPVSSFLVHTDGRFDPGSAEAEVHAAARRSTRIMTDYVREALFFAETLNPRIEPVDLNRVFERVREATAARAHQRRVTLNTTQSFPGPFSADEVLLQRMLANLVTNAIDASTEHKQVVLSVDSGRNGRVRFRVADEGSGIAPELIDRIFDPYFTTKEFGEEVRGFGLGLTIAQKIAQLHGGSITVASKPGEGAIFTVEFPAAVPAERQVDRGSTTATPVAVSLKSAT
jgi:signal transduction histidine kinase